MKRRLFAGALLLAVAAVSGCGSRPDTSNNPKSTISTIRQLKSGDSLTYSITGTAVSDNSTTSVTGTATLSTLADSWTPHFGVREFRQVFSVDVYNGSKHDTWSQTSYLEQGLLGVLYDVGSDDGGQRLNVTSTNAAPIMYRTAMSVGDSWGYTAEYTNATTGKTSFTLTQSTTVTALEAVNNWMAYKIHGTIEGGIGSDCWFVPELGYNVKMNEVADSTEYGCEYHLTYTLTNKNF